MDYAVMVTFPDSEHAYKAFADVNSTRESAGYNVRDLAIITNQDGRIFIPDSYNTGNNFGDDTIYGGLIGMLIGILGGPIGILLGGSVGLAIGYAIDAGDVDDDDSMLFQVAQNLPEGKTALFALVTEEDTAAFDSNFIGQDVTILHWDADDVAAEVRHAEEMQKEMAKEAREKLREERKAARKARKERRNEY